MVSKVIHFLTTDLWRIRLKNYSRTKSFLLKQLRVIVLTVRGFAEDKCKFRASALTFYSLLSIVPVIALMFGIAKGFGLEKKLEIELMQKTEGQQEVIEKIIGLVSKLLDDTNGGFVAGIGIVFLFWTVIKVLSNVESAFNDIWGVKTPRHIGRKFSDYLSIMLVCPFLLVLASSATVMISSQIQTIVQKIQIFSAIGPFIMFLLKLLPYSTIWIVFTFMFIFMPNTKVKFRYALSAGIVAGTIFQVVQWIYINFQIGAANANAIYGSFAALPLFLLWLHISWMAVLFGAEFSFAHQNVDTYEFEPDCLSVNYSFKKLLSLLITNKLVKIFCNGGQPLTAAKISYTLEIPIRLVRQIMFELVGAGILSEVKINGGKDVAYQPAIDTGKLTIKYVIESLENRGHSNIPVASDAEMDRLSKCLETFTSEIEKSSANILLKDV